MPLGEKISEDKWRATGFTIKSTGPEGVSVEISYTGESKGFGRMAGVDGTYMGTALGLQKPNGVVIVISDQGILSTKNGETIVFKAQGGAGRQGGTSATIYTFMTASPKLSWVNDTVFLREGEGGHNLQEGTGAFYEWK